MEVRVNILGKVVYKRNESRSDFEKAELYPFGDGVYAVMDGERFVELRAVSGKKHSEEKGDYYEYIERCWMNGRIVSSAIILIGASCRLRGNKTKEPMLTASRISPTR